MLHFCYALCMEKNVSQQQWSMEHNFPHTVWIVQISYRLLLMFDIYRKFFFFHRLGSWKNISLNLLNVAVAAPKCNGKSFKLALLSFTYSIYSIITFTLYLMHLFYTLHFLSGDFFVLTNCCIWIYMYFC